MTLNEKMANKSILSRSDLVSTLLEILRPLSGRYSKGGAMLHLGYTGAHYGENNTLMEGYTRVLWGMAPLLGADNTLLEPKVQAELEEWRQLYIKGLINGTDPSGAEYWGNLIDYDQKMVEMAALAVAICLCEKQLWEPLTSLQKMNVYSWMDQINRHLIYPNNWIFFRILVNAAFIKLGLSANHECMNEDFRLIESCYLGDGWYCDGSPTQRDYYISFAFHYYSLIYATLMKKRDPERSLQYLQRGRAFANDFIYWFHNDGSEIPYGRSLTYRFAHSAFFSALAFADCDVLDWGVLKRLVLGNIRTWLKRNIFDMGGVLSIGYGYPNLFMSEKYNSPTSPYWALKTFLVLALDESHPFWSAEEKEYSFTQQRYFEKPRMLITHHSGNHVQAYTTGQQCEKNHGNQTAKYCKFVYSNLFAFSISRGVALEDGAFDSALAVSPVGKNQYCMRHDFQNWEGNLQYLMTEYAPLPGVKITSYVVPLGHWHARVHLICNEMALDIADCGYAIASQKSVYQNPQELVKEEYRHNKKDELMLKYPWGSVACAAYTKGEAALITAFPNTNLLYNNTVIPAIIQELAPGTHQVINVFAGVAGGDDFNEEMIQEKPFVQLQKGMLSIAQKSKQVRKIVLFSN